MAKNDKMLALVDQRSVRFYGDDLTAVRIVKAFGEAQKSINRV